MLRSPLSALSSMLLLSSLLLVGGGEGVAQTKAGVAGVAGVAGTDRGAPPQVGEVALEGEAPSVQAAMPLVEQTLILLDAHYLLTDRLAPQALFKGAVQRLAAVADDGLYIPSEDGGPDTLLIGHRTILLEPATLQTRESLGEALYQVGSFYRQATVFRDIETDRELEYTFIRGMLATLDSPTRLLVDAGLESFQVRSKGSLIGVGMVLRLKDGRPYVREVVDGGPSARGGVKTGDRILRIDSESTLDMPMSEVVGRLRGELRTQVKIEVDRVGVEEPLSFVLTRARVKVENVKIARLDGDVGYLEITNFSDRTLSNFRRQFDALEEGGPIKGLVLDLRANRGGSLRQSAYIADQFVNSGLLARTVGRNDERVKGLVERLEARPEVTIPLDMPVVVLVSSSTASGAEILAGALKHHDRALILGQPTFGKGTVQKVYDLDSEARVKTTVARYLIEGDQWLHGVGLEPDVELGAVVIEDGDIRFVGREAGVEALEEEDEEVGPDPFTGEAEARAQYQTFFVDVRGESPKDAPEPTRQERLRKDQAIRLASQIILDSGAFTRSTQLASLKPSVESFAAAQESALGRALSTNGVDWSPKTGVASPSSAHPKLTSASLGLTLTSGDNPSWKLTPGEENIPLSLSLINSGDTPLHRVRVVTISEDRRLDGLDFVFGKVAPGEPSVAARTLRLPLRTEAGVRELRFAVLADELEMPLEVSHLVEVEEMARPALRTRITYLDGDGALEAGDRDGLPEPGEMLRLQVEVENLGEVATGDVALQLKNPLRKDIEIRESRVTLDPIQPGETGTATLAFEVVPVPGLEDIPPVAVEFVLRDRGYGDVLGRELVFATALEGGGAEAPAWFKGGMLLSPPRVTLKGGVPGVASEGGAVTLHAVAKDDSKVRVLSLYADKSKVGRSLGGAASGQRVLSLQQDLELSHGSHLIELVAEDEDGLYGRYRLWATSVPSGAQAEAP